MDIANSKRLRVNGRAKRRCILRPWDPQGGKATGRIRSRVALSGFALINDYEQERDGKVTFTGHGVFTFDPKEDLYTLTWFDCHGRAPGSLQRKI